MSPQPPDTATAETPRGVRPAPVTLVSGPEEFLAERAVASIVARAREADPGVDVRRLPGPDVDPSALMELTSPSLFGESTVLVVDQAHELSSDASTAIADLVHQPVDHLVLVLLHSGQANRAKAVLEACRVVQAPQVACPKASRVPERVEFVRAEASTAGRRMPDDAARTLVDAVGSDLRDLAAAVSQLVADTDGAITVEAVSRYYEGRAEVSSFQVADAAVEGRTADALTQLRYALGSGVSPVLLTGALAQALRSIGRVAAAPRGARAGDLAKDLGMPPWKVDLVRRQVRGWTGDSLAVAVAAVAQADGAVKGLTGAGDPGYALERAIMTIGKVRSG